MDKLKLQYYTLKNSVGQFLVRRKSSAHQEFMRWYYTEGKRLTKFKNIHQGEDCFIIGNGPSLNKMDLSLLKGYHTFGMNKIYYMFDKVDLNLSYYVSVNPLVIQQSKAEIEQMYCPSFVSYSASRDVLNNASHIYRLFTKGTCDIFKGLEHPIFEGYTVTYVALQIAFYMGFKRVFLIGVDHNFKYSGNPNEKQVMSHDDPNHFDPRYFAGNEWHLPDLENSEFAYNLGKFLYRESGREVYDATVDGKLTVFPKIGYEDALKLVNRKQ